jgi:hypothetical protein
MLSFVALFGCQDPRGVLHIRLQPLLPVIQRTGVCVRRNRAENSRNAQVSPFSAVAAGCSCRCAVWEGIWLKGVLPHAQGQVVRDQ